MANLISSALGFLGFGLRTTGRAARVAGKTAAGLGKEGAYALWDRKAVSGKILRGALGFGGYYAAGQVGSALIQDLKNDTRVTYGLTQDEATMYDSASSLLRTVGVAEGAASIFGFSHLQRLRYLGKDISNVVPGGKLRKNRKEYAALSASEKAVTIEQKKKSLFKPSVYKHQKPGISKFKSISRLSLNIGEAGFAGLIGQASELLPSVDTLTRVSLTASMLPAAVAGFSVAKLGLNVFSEGMGRAGLRGLTTAIGVSIGAASIAGGAAVGMRTNMYPAAEGNIQNIGRESPTNKMNFSTAGLSLALHRLR